MTATARKPFLPWVLHVVFTRTFVSCSDLSVQAAELTVFLSLRSMTQAGQSCCSHPLLLYPERPDPRGENLFRSVLLFFPRFYFFSLSTLWSLCVILLLMGRRKILL